MADEPTPTSTVDITREPTLPGLELPDYHGRKPTGMKTSVNGAGNRLSRSHEIGERVVLVVEARAKKAGHEETDDGLVYAETLKVVDLFEVSGAPGTRLLSAVRQAYREADDDRLGRVPLPLDPEEGAEVVTAADGTVLTPTELAELRGDPAAAMADERLSPVVVVYSDGLREAWPDDFDPGEAKPEAGQRFEVDDPGDSGPVAYVYVKTVLNAETGETVAEWTDEQEHDRLLALEQAAEAEEAAEATPVPPIVDPTYFRIEHEDGSVEEVGPVEFAARGGTQPGETVYAVDADGFEAPVLAVEAPELPGTDLADGPPLPGEEGYGDGARELGEPDPGDNVVAGDFPPELSADDFAAVDTDLDDLKGRILPGVVDVEEARRLLEAEKRGRGRGLQTRKGATDAILKRIAELEKAGEPDA